MEVVTTLSDIVSPKNVPNLSLKMRRFMRAYNGDLVYSLRVAGYQGTDLYLKQKGEEILARPDIQHKLKWSIENQEKREGALLSKIDRMEFLAGLVRNSDPYERQTKDDYGQETQPAPPTITERLKALDMYNKMEGDYHTNTNINVTHSMSELILSSYVDSHRPLDIIEASYKEMQNEAAEGGELTVESKPDLLGL